VYKHSPLIKENGIITSKCTRYNLTKAWLGKIFCWIAYSKAFERDTCLRVNENKAAWKKMCIRNNYLNKFIRYLDTSTAKICTLRIVGKYVSKTFQKR